MGRGWKRSWPQIAASFVSLPVGPTLLPQRSPQATFICLNAYGLDPRDLQAGKRDREGMEMSSSDSFGSVKRTPLPSPSAWSHQNFRDLLLAADIARTSTIYSYQRLDWKNGKRP